MVQPFMAGGVFGITVFFILEVRVFLSRLNKFHIFKGDFQQYIKVHGNMREYVGGFL